MILKFIFFIVQSFIPKSKIQNLDQLEEFIQTKSAWVSQVTLYSYLKQEWAQDMFFILITMNL
jgi:hypothetical protein